MKTLAILLAASTTLAAPYPSNQNSPLNFYVALQSTGILSISFDPAQDVNTSLSITGYTTNAGYHPDWLTSHNDKIYSISRTNYPGTTSGSGGLFALEEQSTPSLGTNNLTLLNSVSSHGLGGIHCDVSPDGTLLSAANIDGSSVAVYPLSPAGIIGDASHVFKHNLTQPGPGTNESQIQANPHQAIFDPSGNFLVVPDRGSDRVYIYSVNSHNNIIQTLNLTLPPGTGPRHATFRQVNATRSWMYLVSELDNTVRVYTLDHEDQSPNHSSKRTSWFQPPPASTPTPILTPHQTISTLNHTDNTTRTPPKPRSRV
ncbi:hypothetical protein OHC33_003326 [Knufia fluminis]|uniref:6-phosphogluconolactonase n=1 Tax=Knufia fluminis TaxID=191047 RepID=A0AAN8IAK6_9EURO|nr:hypothetical protein OHC33_003326 [Knufia fluminis]